VTSGSFNIEFQPQPFIHGQRFSFKPTRNFEFGFSRSTVMDPAFRLLPALSERACWDPAMDRSPQDPGDRRSGLDWSYRLPGLRDWVTLYGDALADDQFSPIAYWDRSAIRAGLYFSHLPKIPKLDLRMEGVYTDVPSDCALSRGFYYFNLRFKEGYTNDGNLLGSWIGREGQGGQAWTNYWFGARNRLQLNFRHQKSATSSCPSEARSPTSECAEITGPRSSSASLHPCSMSAGCSRSFNQERSAIFPHRSAFRFSPKSSCGPPSIVKQPGFHFATHPELVAEITVKPHDGRIKGFIIEMPV
jgi:Capsule assembly protein Wzi